MVNNVKIDTSLWLAYSLPENLRDNTEGLNVGFNRETRQWEPKVRNWYAQSTFRLPWQPFRQVTDAKLCKRIPGFARFLPYYNIYLFPCQ